MHGRRWVLVGCCCLAAAGAAAEQAPSSALRLKEKPKSYGRDGEQTGHTPTGAIIDLSSTDRYWIRKSEEAGDGVAALGVVAVHGGDGSALSIWNDVVAAAQYNSVPAEALMVVAPDFSGRDGPCGAPRSDEPMRWRGTSWSTGGIGDANGPSNSTSLHVLDSVVEMLNDQDRFPNIARIVMLGFGAGANLVQRYALVAEPDVGQLPVSYLVISAISYAYLSNWRTEETTACAKKYNEWEYGLAAYSVSPVGLAYSRDFSNRKHMHDYIAKRIAYLVGTRDVGPDTPLSEQDTSCPANTQGSYPLDRAKNFWKHLSRFSPNVTRYQSLRTVIGGTHSPRGMLASGVAADIMFNDNTSARAPHEQHLSHLEAVAAASGVLHASASATTHATSGMAVSLMCVGLLFSCL